MGRPAIRCAHLLVRDRQCIHSGWIEHGGSHYCSMHDPLKGQRSAQELEDLRKKIGAKKYSEKRTYCWRKKIPGLDKYIK